MLLQVILNGLIAGGLYALLGLGFSLCYTSAKFFDLSHAVSYLVAGYTALVLVGSASIVGPVAWLAAVVATIAVAVSLEALLFRRLRRRQGSSSVLLVTSLGMLIVVQNFVAIVFGDDPQRLVSGQGQSLAIGGARVTLMGVVSLAAAAAVFGLFWLVIHRTAIGRRIRAIAADEELALAIGIDVERTRSVAIVMASGVAGIAGLVLAYDRQLYPAVGLATLFYAAISAIIGGVNRPAAAFGGGLIVGLFQHLSAVFVSAVWQAALLFLLVALFMFARPHGLFGAVPRLARV